MSEQIEGFRLSPQQAYLWRLQQAGGAAPFVAQAVVHAEGSLDRDALRTAAGALVHGHEILRTAFQCLPGTTVPVQVIREEAEPHFEVVDLSDAEADEQAAGVGRAAAEARARVVGAAGGGLDVTVVQLAEASHELVVTVPALCGDAAGAKLLAAELGRAYGEAVGGSASADEPLQYADLAEWQNELLAEVHSFDAPGAFAVELPFVQRTTRDAFEPAVVEARLDGALAAQIESGGGSVSTFLLGCWQVLLRRLTGEDLSIGVACEGRAYEGLDTALGLFARDLPLPVEVDGQAPLSALLERTDARVGELLDRQEYFAWDRLNAAAANGATVPFFRVAFGFESWSDAFEAGGVSFSARSLHATTQRFQVRLVCAQCPDHIAVRMHYDTSCCHEADVRRLAEQFVRLVRSAVDHPDVAVARLDILGDEERQRILTGFNREPVEYPSDKCIHALIESHVERTPNAVAVACGDDQLTYAELDRRAGALAARLQELGVGPDVFVGVCAQRSVEMIVGILAALKAGGAYVPLDPAYPAARLQFMLEDSAAPVVLAQDAVAAVLGEHGCTVVSLDQEHDGAAPASPVTADNLAYAIYTSGSTGTPKGVGVSHRNLVHSTTAREHVYPAAPGVYLLLSSFAFDSSVPGIFWTLCSGGTLVLPAEGLERDLHELARLIEAHQVTHTLALPSLYSVLLRETGSAGLGSLACVIVAGEACPRDTVDAHRRALPEAELFNEYGPTEATVWSTVHRCTEDAADGRVPIGHPIPNARVYLLDPEMQPVPVGVPGEMFIGGEGVTPGYLRRPEMTAERFVDDPFVAGQRLYRTGDLARYLADGTIDFLGRVDNQVKVRGYRIELEEIEDAMGRAPGVDEAVVVAHAEASGDTQLAAFATGSSVDPDAVREALAAALPDYMVPASIQVLASLPRMPNGKVDRNALPAPDAVGPARPPFVEPSTALERVLAGMWSELLGVDAVGLDDNFFRLGGHSLLVTQLIFRLREVLPVEISLRAVFDHPTVGALAEVLRGDGEQREAVERAAASLSPDASPRSDSQ